MQPNAWLSNVTDFLHQGGNVSVSNLELLGDDYEQCELALPDGKIVVLDDLYFRPIAVVAELVGATFAANPNRKTGDPQARHYLRIQIPGKVPETDARLARVIMDAGPGFQVSHRQDTLDLRIKNLFLRRAPNAVGESRREFLLQYEQLCASEHTPEVAAFVFYHVRVGFAVADALLRNEHIASFENLN